MKTKTPKIWEVIEDEKVAGYSLGLTSFFFPEWLECQSCSHLINFLTLLRSPCCPMMCFVDMGLYLSAHRECCWEVVLPELWGDDGTPCCPRIETKQTETWISNYRRKMAFTCTQLPDKEP
jgi:hypothetical protein